MQVRLINNTKSLDRWYGEFVAAYMPSKHWEIVPDLRYTIKPSESEVRPGLGILYKNLFSKSQLVHQFKYQADIGLETGLRHGFRYVMFYNIKMSDNLLANLVGGGFYSWSDDFSGIQFIRAGGGFNWLLDVKHILSLNYFYGASQLNDGLWVHQGSALVQFTIKLNKEYQYVPAYFINF
ncbi:hypothetical protein OAH12_01020 [Cyclobacteriaceae bacterium]|nr:hypothetical protein [Cyclobacteriaceae bacterium]